MLSKSVVRIYPANRALDFGLTLTPDFTSHSGQSLKPLWVQAAVWLTETQVPLVMTQGWHCLVGRSVWDSRW